MERERGEGEVKRERKQTRPPAGMFLAREDGRDSEEEKEGKIETDATGRILAMAFYTFVAFFFFLSLFFFFSWFFSFFFSFSFRAGCTPLRSTSTPLSHPPSPSPSFSPLVNLRYLYSLPVVLLEYKQVNTYVKGFVKRQEGEWRRIELESED